MTVLRTPALLFASHVAALGGGYLLAPKQPIDTVVEHTGYFQVDTKKVLSATVESLREEAKLAVFSFKGSARVRAERTKFWVFSGTQELVVPGIATYFVNLSDLSLADVTYDERAKIVRIKLPRVTLGDIALAPEQATTINGGTLTYSEDQVEALRRMNFASARRAIVAQAQQRGLLNSARRQAVASVESYFAIPLRVAGLPDVKVAATFE